MTFGAAGGHKKCHYYALGTEILIRSAMSYCGDNVVDGSFIYFYIRNGSNLEIYKGVVFIYGKPFCIFLVETMC